MKEETERVVLRELALRDYIRLKKKGVKTIIWLAMAGYLILEGAVMVGQKWWPLVNRYLEETQIEKWKFAFWASWLNYLISMVLINLFFIGLYSLKSPRIDSYKTQKDEKWPWLENPKEWANLLRKTFFLVLINSLIVFPAMIYILAFMNGFTVRHPFEIDKLPTKWTLIWQIFFCFVMEDIGFSVSHRLLHTPLFYRHIHKIHHQYTKAVAISANYTHPVEFALGNMLPVGLPCIILGRHMHFYTFLLWAALRVVNTTFSHSGYDFPFLLPWDLFPLRNTPAYHDYHHAGGDFQGNYASVMTICDTLWGTNKKYFREYKENYYKTAKSN
jgi:sterol desaturase/sphingolipid hydroxylase (fatty acid hydroxylase superfamily)